MSKKDLEFKIDGEHHPTKKGNISNLKVQGNDATFNAILDRQIRNEKDLMNAAGVDQKEWMVAQWECTMWEQGAKYRDQDLKWFGVEGSAQVMEGYSIRKNEWIKQQLWRVKASFKRNITYMQMNDFKSELMDEIKKFLNLYQSLNLRNMKNLVCL
ncbi:MAG: hypothetical protein IPL84_03895 [Chitinophagaceae bacterium]|nr:hypothetical protein [Chitinophagaceae bacterium]